MEKVVIVGAGPSGLLFAHYLLNRGDRYQIEIYDRLGDPQNPPNPPLVRGGKGGLGDPREVALSNSRTIAYTLNERGMAALRPIDGLEKAVRSVCVEHSTIVFHKANGKTQLLSQAQPLLNTNRISLVQTLLSSLLETAGANRVKLHFHCQCIGVDFERQTILFESVSPDTQAELNPLQVHYDRLIGADGSRSMVRSQFLKLPFFDFEQKTYRSCYKTLFFPSKNDQTGSELQPKGFHGWRIEEGINFTAVPQVTGGYIGGVFVPRTRQEILNFTSVSQVKEFFGKYVPEVSLLLSDAEAEAFMKRPISTQLRVRCNRYHHGDRVLLMGDAAHAVSSSTGQGCNVALEDVQIFDRLLDESKDCWEIALANFTERRLPDAHALWELDGNVFPLSKLLFAEFILQESWAKIARRLFPNLVAPPLRELMNSSTLPFSEILKIYRGWVAKVKASNQKISR